MSVCGSIARAHYGHSTEFCRARARSLCLHFHGIKVFSLGYADTIAAPTGSLARESRHCYAGALQRHCSGHSRCLPVRNAVHLVIYAFGTQSPTQVPIHHSLVQLATGECAHIRIHLANGVS